MLPQVSRDERRKQRLERVLEEKLLKSSEDPNEKFKFLVIKFLHHENDNHIQYFPVFLIFLPFHLGSMKN